MEKPAQTDHPIHEILARRWSPRAFSPRAVEREKILSLLEAARWAPSCFNEQPWSFVVTTRDEPESHGLLLGCLSPGNKWAEAAPVLMLSVAKLAFDHNGKPNRHAGYDVGQAVAGLSVQATSMGLFLHQMAGFDAGEAREAFAIPEGFEPMAAIALGYPGDPAQLPEPLREREAAPRSRRPVPEFVFGREWGRPAGFLEEK